MGISQIRGRFTQIHGYFTLIQPIAAITVTLADGPLKIMWEREIDWLRSPAYDQMWQNPIQTMWAV